MQLVNQLAFGWKFCARFERSIFDSFDQLFDNGLDDSFLTRRN